MGNVIRGPTVSQDAFTAYNNFLCTYGLLHTEMLPNDAIEHATYMWCNFSPEQQMSFAHIYPCHPGYLPYKMRSDYVTDTLPTKAKLKVKMPANKCRNKIKPSLAASKKNHLVTAKKRKSIGKGVKKKAQPRKEPRLTGFQLFFKTLRDRHSEITDKEIVKKAAKAWCSMNPRQRQNFLR